MAEIVEFENDRVRVLRVKHGPRGRNPKVSRYDRVIIYITDGQIRRTENAKQETMQRKAGAVVWKKRSQHEIENLKDTDHEVFIIELKK